MPSQTHRTSTVPIPQRRPDRTGASEGGMGNAAIMEMLGLNAEAGTQVPLRTEMGEADQESDPTLPVFEGYDSPWHQANDALIIEVVQAFNAEKGWGPDHPDHLDPALVKAWALQESGGHQDVYSQGDMMQMNVPGDWVREKKWFGISGKREKLDPRKSLEVALRWAYYKGEITRAKRSDAASDGWHDTQRGTKSVPGYESQFSDWNTALDGYNGGGVNNYADKINNRLDAAR